MVPGGMERNRRLGEAEEIKEQPSTTVSSSSVALTKSQRSHIPVHRYGSLSTVCPAKITIQTLNLWYCILKSGHKEKGVIASLTEMRQMNHFPNSYFIADYSLERIAHLSWKGKLCKCIFKEKKIS